jgi:alpha-ketoglutarate-dependent taurine dioxygenase
MTSAGTHRAGWLAAARQAGLRGDRPGAPRVDDPGLALDAVRDTSAAGALPAVLEPARPDLSLPLWLSRNSAGVRRRLDDSGALLFRGFGVHDAAQLELCATALSGELLEYRENTSPRTAVRGRVATSTDFPADQEIALHNEQSYSAIFPLYLFFSCTRPAENGGETPLADCRRVSVRLDPDLRREFRDRGWCYAANFLPHFGRSWRSIYQVETALDLEAYLRRVGIDWEWTERGHLRTRLRRDTEYLHPRTGERVWFNHLLFWHASNLDPALRALLEAEYGSDGLPHDARFGDGAPIPMAIIDAVREAYRAETRTFQWQPGDLVIIDNVLVAHGRRPYTGPRKILFAMAEPIDRAVLRPPLAVADGVAPPRERLQE